MAELNWRKGEVGNVIWWYLTTEDIYRFISEVQQETPEQIEMFDEPKSEADTE